MITTRKTTLALGAALAALALPTGAQAGTYEVRACDEAGGAQNSWVAWSSYAQMASYSVCPSYGDWSRGIVARNAIQSGSHVAPKKAGAWQFFYAPADTAITNVRVTGELFRAAGQRWNVGLSNGSTMLAGIQADTTHAWSWKPVNYDIAVPRNNYVYWEAACWAETGCDLRSTGDAATHYSRAAIWLRGTTVTIDDPTAPGVGWGGSLTAGGWMRGDRNLDWSASDNTGIRRIDANLAGRSVANIERNCDYTRPAPCSGNDGGTIGVATAGFPDGVHDLELVVRDAADNPNRIWGQVAIDNNAPGRVSDVRVSGGEDWRPTNSFRLDWTNPGGQHAPLVRRHYKLCTTEGADCRTGSDAGGNTSITLSVPRPGAWKAQVWMEDAAGNVSAVSASDPVTLRFDDVAPPLAKITAPDGWIGDEQARELTVALGLEDPSKTPASGVLGYSVTTDGTEPDATVDTDAKWLLRDLPEGDIVLKARAVSGARKPGPTATRTLRVDRTAPETDASDLPDPGTWQQLPAIVQLTGTDDRSGVAAVRWQIDSAEPRQNTGDAATVTVADDGRHTLTWETVDQAGNRSQARQATIRVDRSAPDVAEVLPLDPNRPRQVTGRVSDRGSGIDGAVLQMRPAGSTWRDLDTAVNLDAGHLTASLDDLQLPDGRYELRAVATDRVGNVKTGDPSAVTLPLRVASRVSLDAPAARKARNAKASSATLTGRLTAADGQPIAGQPIVVYTRSRIEQTWRTERTIASAPDGRFGYAVPGGPTRTIRFVYAGNETIRPAAADHSVTTKAKSTIKSSRRKARLGQRITFTGKLAGGPIPNDGKVLELQAYDGGRWRAFPQVVRTDRNGNWRTTLRFERTRGIYTYKIRARVFRDSSYAYETGVSRTVRVTVRGR